MENCIWFEIKNTGVVFKSVYLTKKEICQEQIEYEDLQFNHEKHQEKDAWLVGYFIITLTRSPFYRKRVLKTFLRNYNNNFEKYPSTLHVHLELVWPIQCPMDINFSEKLNQLAVERRELDHAMSWLSTLGGAFSALGEQFSECAEMAGRISIGQMRLALRIGDPNIISRCKLWFSLSLMQRGYLKEAKKIINDQWVLVQKQKPPLVYDHQMLRICQGLWAKLRYLKHLEKCNKNILTQEKSIQ